MPCLILSLLILLCLTACDDAPEKTADKLPSSPTISQQEIQALGLPPDRLSSAEESEVDAMALPPPPAWFGDLDSMRKTRAVRILVPYSKTFYLIDRGRQMGVTYEFGKAFEKWLNKHQPFADKAMRWHVVFIPTKRDQLFPRLLAGYGDIAAGALTITEQRLKIVDFSEPTIGDVREAIVTGPESPRVTKLEDLAGQDVYVHSSSSYMEHLLALNQRFKAAGLAAINIIPANENLEPEDLLQMVNAGLLSITVVDNHIAELWQPLYTDMVVHDEFFLHEDGNIGWAMRKDSPELKQALDKFAKQHKLGTEFGNIMQQRFFNNSDPRVDASSKTDMRRFNALVGLFEKYARIYDFDHLMLMAQGFQESRLKQSARSHAGAVGIMQVLPSTAAEMGIKDVARSAERNIEAGSKYLRMVSDTYLDDPAILPENRTLLSFAAYNAGPGNLMKFRRLAEKSGLDPNVWFGNVEQSAARIIGRETVDYVGNIYKYYIAYKLSAEKLKLRDMAAQQQH